MKRVLVLAAVSEAADSGINKRQGDENIDEKKLMDTQRNNKVSE